jgi:hypothetical protein
MPTLRSVRSALIALALLIQTCVPAGWMPAHAGRTVTLTWCGDTSIVPAAHRAASLLADASNERNRENNDSERSPKVSCAFAVNGTSLAADGDSTLIEVLVVLASICGVPVAASVGQGLAAPPPPATGPPALS